MGDTAVSLASLCADMLDETASLERLVGPLDEAGWQTPTPSPGWSIRDQVLHLAHTDDATRLSAENPEEFARQRAAAQRDPAAVLAGIAAADRDKTGAAALAFLHEARTAFVAAVRDREPAQRIAWYGPDMSLTSAVTARIMETWAHGQDCFDALTVEHEPSPALRHVAFIGVRTFANSFRAKGRPVPDVAVRVELDAPDGSQWVFGPPEAGDVVRGPAVDFCLVVTQRRHRDDTDLVSTGPVAAEWLAIAQAYAGTGGAGRTPGQFRRREPGGEARGGR